MKSLRIIGSLILLTIGVYAQEAVNLKGLVTNKEGAAAGAAVKVVSTTDRTKTYATKTNEKGEYKLTGFPAGTYEVTANLETRDLKQVSPTFTVRILYEATTEVDLELAQVNGIRESVTVSAGRSQPIEQVSKTVDVISAQEMRDRADFSLAETLRTVPGFRVAQLGGFGRTATIKTRGLRNQDTAILIDGIRFRDASAITGDASPFLSDITLTSISKIEVLRGSGSSLYGTNAIGGTVDVQTPEARSGTHGQVSGAVGGLGLGRFRGNLSHGMSNGKFGVTTGLSRTAYTKGIDGQDNASNTNFQGRVDIRPFSRTNLSARVFVSDASVRLNSGPDTFGTLPASGLTPIKAVANSTFKPDENDPDSFQRSRIYTLQFAGTQAIDSRTVIAGHYQYLRSRRRNDDGPLGAGFQSAFFSTFEGTIQTGNVHITWTPIRQNTLTAGYEFERERFENTGGTPGGTGNFLTSSVQSSNTFYVQDLLELFDERLQLSGAFRVQSFSLEKPQCGTVACPSIFNTTVAPPAAYTGDASAAYLIRSSGTKLRAHVGNGYREPSLYERFGSYFFFNSFFPLGNSGLKPERSSALDAGVEQSFAKDRVKLVGTYFYTVINDEITYLPTDDFLASAYYNFDKHFSRGVEFSATVKPSNTTDIFGSYTFTNSDVRNFRRPSFPVGPVFSSDSRAFGIPDHQFTLVATQRFRRAWVNFDLLATSSYLAPIFSNTTFSSYIYRFGGNRKGDLTAGYTFTFDKENLSLRVYGTIENVFDQEYYESGFRTARRSGRIGLAFAF